MYTPCFPVGSNVMTDFFFHMFNTLLVTYLAWQSKSIHSMGEEGRIMATLISTLIGGLTSLLWFVVC